MSERPLLQLIAVSALLGPTLSSGVGLAEPEPIQLVAFRGGVSLEGGSNLVPPGFTVGMVGVQGHAGFQSAAIAFYAAACADFMFGRYHGLNLSAAPMIDYTWTYYPRTFTLGVGPEWGGFVALAGPPRKLTPGYYVGGKLHLSFNPMIEERTWEHGHAKAISFGLDIHLVGYEDAGRFASPPGGDTAQERTSALLWAMLTVGFQKF